MSGLRSHLVRYLLPVLLILVAVAGFLHLKSTRPEAPPAGDEERSWPVAALSVAIAEQSPEVRLFGKIGTDSTASLRARSAGDVVSVAVQAGQMVVAGDLLLELDPTDARVERDQRLAELQDLESQIEQRVSQHALDRQALQQERELLALAERQLQRIKSLAEGNRAAQRDVDLAEQSLLQQQLALMNRELAVSQHPSRLKQLEAAGVRARGQLELSERNLQATHVVAATDMRIVDLMVAPGDRVTANTVLLTHFSPIDIELESRIPMRYLPQLQDALASDITLEAFADIDGSHYVFVLERLAAATDQSAAVLAGFRLGQGHAERLPLGRFAEAWMRLPINGASVWIPAEALHGRDRVYLIKEGRLQSLTVDVLGETRRNGQAGLLISATELSEGDQLLANRLPQAMQGLRVEVVEQLSIPGEGS
ncbi:efflux RND transporter periplasmic adaptor subunit [Nitrincola alkalilacustris]|uniref:efflux RND transporter periplasmic adaptor subunit n=1 Tax=Nitrincola alkalilacustris TaxID=1571224 RepID=UPI00124E2950|nr:biotin/lipoyl-binding protein [Nitrincola alkalilacustris]